MQNFKRKLAFAAVPAALAVGVMYASVVGFSATTAASSPATKPPVTAPAAPGAEKPDAAEPAEAAEAAEAADPAETPGQAGTPTVGTN
jgi:hypothetical protein